MENMESRERREQIAVSFEKASEADIEALIDVEKSVGESKTYSSMTSEQAWKEELAEYEVYLIKSGDTVIGSLAYAEKTPDHIHISGVIVRPDFQGKGAGTQAVQRVLDRYPSAKRIDLVTHPENKALKLYESLGFKVEERVEDYFGDGEPRLKLALTRE